MASRERVDPNSGKIDRYVAGEHMESDDLKVHRWGQVGDGYLGPAFHRRFRPGQVLYGSRRAYLRKVAVAEFDGVTANTTYVLETKDRDRMLQEFLPFVMTTELFHAFAIQESKGSVNPYLNWSDVARYEFDLPPVDEQRRIADLFWAVERDRQAAKRVVVALDDAVKDLTDTSLARSGASERPLADVLEVCQYGLSIPADEEGPYPLLRMTNLLAGAVVGQDLKYCEISAEDLEAYRLLPGDVLFNRTNSVEHVGRSGLFDLEGDFVFASYLVRLRPRFGILDSEYLNYFINSRLGQRRIRVHLSKGVQQANISATKLKMVRIPIPAIEIQRAIVSRIDALRQSRRAAASRVSAISELSATLRREVFGGLS
ncbi:restriction endonuclease subunit S [Micromonospora sp. WMMA1976]|uniref:restriction endonuclease subunit S n=1 Tax=Micromonospora sp. WMMA1976 TaxID=3014995 RepID=UPI00248CC7FE|nr:restriction endonuclease subunit S [Micromonospora sp. WMMA1976]WBC04333.1 restriction endonuclease subunit S [Micromonospora sp. WMMA1976]